MAKIVIQFPITMSSQSGSVDYNDLLNKPFIPDKTSDITNDGENAMSTYIEDNEISAVGKSGDYNDLNNIPSTFSPSTHSHVISDVTGLQTALDSKVDENAVIVGATKTKITYDSKGLVTVGEDATTADIAEGTNLYFTTARVLATVLTGLSLATGGAIVSTDTVLQAFGKIQNQINNLSTVYQSILVSGTNIKTFAGISLLGSGDAAVPQDIITTVVSITTATITDNGYSQSGRNILIKNGANAINLTCDGGVTTTYQKGVGSTGAITFVQGSGRTLIQVNGTAILNGAVGSIASLTSDGTTDFLIITNF